MTDLRKQLPNRRVTNTRDVVWRGRRLTISVGVDESGKVREVFGDYAKIGSDAEANLDDALILVSLMLQSGWDIWDIKTHLSREGTDITAPAASVVGYAIEVAANVGE